MTKTLKSILKKTVGAVGLAVALSSISGCKDIFGNPIGIPFYDSGKEESPLTYGEVELLNGNKYVGEMYYNKSLNSDGRKHLHGYGTLFDKDRRIVYEGYWNMGHPTGRDPLGDRRERR